jgi:group I intron endonuclease
MGHFAWLFLRDYEYGGNNKMIVYKATSPSGKIYIGITKKSLEERIKSHFYDSKKNSKRYFYKAINKYGIENIKFEIIDTAYSWEELCIKEKYYIDKYQSNNKIFGYNCTNGGEGVSGRKVSNKTKQKMSISRKKYCTNNKIVLNKDQKNKISNQKIELYKNADVRNDMAINHGSAPFLVYNAKTNEFIGEWINRRQCIRDLNIKGNHIAACLSGKRKSCGGYIFIKKK